MFTLGSATQVLPWEMWKSGFEVESTQKAKRKLKQQNKIHQIDGVCLEKFKARSVYFNFKKFC
jgi:hypothetical protein